MPRPAKRKDITPNDPKAKRPEASAQATGFLRSLTSLVLTNHPADNPELVRSTSQSSLVSTSSSQASKISVDRMKLMSAKNFGKMRDMIEV